MLALRSPKGEGGGWTVVPTTANFAKQKITVSPPPIQEAGYVFVYLSYLSAEALAEVDENAGTTYVNFDDIKVTHTKNNIVQYNEYYAFQHTTSHSWTRENATGNNFLGNGGTEVNTTTALYDLEFRNLDPILGRMHQIDPMAAKYSSLTPYNVSFNAPTNFTDVNGADPDGRANWTSIVLPDFPPRPMDSGLFGWGGWMTQSDPYLRQFGVSLSFGVLRYSYAGTLERMAEEQQERDEKYSGYGPRTRNVMITMNNPLQALAAALSTNENWHIYNASSMVDAADYITNYVFKFGKLRNLVVRSHGTGGGLALGMGEFDDGNDRLCTSDECFTTVDLIDIGNGSAVSEADKMAYRAIVAFAKAMDVGGNLIFSGCYAGKEDKPGSTMGFGARLHARLLKDGVEINFSMYFNRGPSRARWGEKIYINGVYNRTEYHVLDRPLSKGFDWIKVAPNGEVFELKHTFQLNSRKKDGPLKKVYP